MDDLILKLKMLVLYRWHLLEWYQEIWKQDSSARMCCDGRECGCYGSCYGDMWERLLKHRKYRP